VKNLLILGGLGFIGSNIISEFLKNETGYNIIAFEFPGVINHFGKDIKLIQGDFNNVEEIETVFRTNKIDIVIHLISTTIPVTSNANIIYDIEANLETSIRLLNILVKYRVPKVIFLSSGGTVYGITNDEKVSENSETFPISSHGVIKLTIEKYLHLYHHLYNLNYLILRVGNPYGPYHKSDKQGVINVFLNKIIHKQPLIIRGDGNSLRDYIYVEDLSHIIFKLIDENINNEIINIGSGEGTTINQIIEILTKIDNNLEVKYSETSLTEIPRIILDISKLNSIYSHSFCGLKDGILKTHKYVISQNTINQ